MKRFILIVILFGFWPGMMVWAVDQTVPEQKGVKAYGVVQNISEDRQMEKIGGIYEPEGLDKYMKRKFEALTAHVDEMEQRLNEQIKQLDQKMTRMEAKIAPSAAPDAVPQKQESAKSVRQAAPTAKP